MKFGTQTCTPCEGEHKDISTLKYITIRITIEKCHGWLYFSFPLLQYPVQILVPDNDTAHSIF